MIDVLHQLAHPVVVFAYLLLGGPLTGFVARQFSVDTGAAKGFLRAFFVACAATHGLLWAVLILWDAMPGWMHTSIDVVCWVQAVATPVFAFEAWRRWDLDG